MLALAAWAYNEHTQRKATERALFEQVALQLFSDEKELRMHWKWSFNRIPERSYPNFFRFMSDEIKRKLERVREDLGYSLTVLPEEGIGIGFSTVAVGESDAKRYGAHITVVLENSPAARSGLCAGDLITAVNGAHVTVDSGAEPALELRAHLLAQDPSVFQVTRMVNGKERTILVTVSGRQKLRMSFNDGMWAWTQSSEPLRTRLDLSAAYARELARDSHPELRGPSFLNSLQAEMDELVAHTEKYIPQFEDAPLARCN